MAVSVEPVTGETWRDVASLRVTESQRAFVAEPAYYLSLCCYGDLWHPLAVRASITRTDRARTDRTHTDRARAESTVVGFLMWAIDPEDRSCWLGGILIDRDHQGRGYGRAAVEASMRSLRDEQEVTGFALSYEPDNVVARGLYRSLGFEETGEREDDEIVARLRLA